MGPLTTFLHSQLSEGSVGPFLSKIAEKEPVLTPAEIHRLADNLVSEWDRDPELRARSLALIGKTTKDRLSTRDLEMMVRLLHATHSKNAEVEYHGKKFPGYNKPISSDKKDKKMMVLAKKGDQVKLVHFGQKGYQHNYSPEAKQNYLTRSAGIRNKSGELTKDDPFSPNYWARKVLWPKGKTGEGSNGPVKTEVRVSSEKKASTAVDMTKFLAATTVAPALALYLALPKGTKKKIAEEIRDPRLYSNLRGGLSGETAKERVAAHKHLEAGPHSILSAAHAGFTREKKASLFDTIAARKENEKWAAAAKLAADDNFGHGAELAGLGILAVPAAASLIGKKFKMPGLHRFGESDAVKHSTELVGLGTLAAPSVSHFLKKKPSTSGQQ